MQQQQGPGEIRGLFYKVHPPNKPELEPRRNMIQRASYRRLLGNGRAALLAAIEIYNKPRIEYRDECFVILLLNAWELTLKALLAKNQQSVFYKKRRGEPRRTYSLTDALKKAEIFIPASLVRQAISANLGLLITYRDNSVHFYNAKSFGSIIYALAQTNIINLKDLLSECFSVNLAEDITWHLLPLGIDSPIDPIEYIAGKTQAVSASNAVKQFLAQIASSAHELESKNLENLCWRSSTGEVTKYSHDVIQFIKNLTAGDIQLAVKEYKQKNTKKLPATATLNFLPGAIAS